MVQNLPVIEAGCNAHPYGMSRGGLNASTVRKASRLSSLKGFSDCLRSETVSYEPAKWVKESISRD